MKNKWREISPKNPGFRLVCLFELWSRSSIVKIIAFAVWHPVVTKETWGEWMDALLSQHHTNNNWEQTFRLSYNCIRFTVIVKWNWLIGLVQLELDGQNHFPYSNLHVKQRPLQSHLITPVPKPRWMLLTFQSWF